MNYQKTLPLFSLLLLLLTAGCDLLQTENKNEEIEAFIKSQSLPDIQTPVYLFNVPAQDFKAFRVPFGPAHDCPSGCFYNQAFGIKYGNRIGWTAVNTADTLKDSSLVFFDVHQKDDYLFSQEILNRFQKALENSEDGSWNTQAYKSYLKMVARDTDTPTDALLNIGGLLSRQYHPGVAMALIKNPIVKTNRRILETLVELPTFNGSKFYKQVRDQARIFLNRLKEEVNNPG